MEQLDKIHNELKLLNEALKDVAIQLAVCNSITRECKDIVDKMNGKVREHEVVLTQHKTYWGVVKWVIGSSAGIGSVIALISFLS